MIEKEIKITADTSEADKDINSLLENIKDNTKDATDEVKDLKNEVRDVGDTAKKGVSGVDSLKKSFKGLGLAFKALGIGLLLQGIQLIGELFSKNQRVVDFFATTFEALSIAFNDFFNFILDNTGDITAFFKDVFENPVENVKKLGDLIKDNLIERLKSLLDVAGFLGDALSKLFEGDFKGAFESVKDAGVEMVDVFTGVDNTIEKVTDTVTSVVDAVTDYTKETLAAAKANVELRNTAELAAAQQARLVEQYDRQAEIQRQIRDDESKSISDRIEANDELGRVLERQAEAMGKQAALQVAAAQSRVDTNNSIENQVALTDALANQEAILAQIEGFRSEQLVNKIALQKEEIELNQTISDREKERRLAQLDFEAELEQNEIQKIQKRRERLEQENIDILEDLETKRELFALGTQARVDAEQDYLDKKQEIDNQLILNARELADEEAKISKDKTEKQIQYEENVKDASIQLAGQTLDIVAGLAEEGSALAKGVAVAQAIISTYQGINAALAQTTDPTPFQVLRFANAAAVGIAGLLNVQKILDTQPVETSVPSGGGSGQVPPPPSFNLVEGTAENQISDSIQSQDEPVRAYVVSGDITTAQQADRNIIEGSSI
jgi:hypothetical protein